MRLHTRAAVRGLVLVFLFSLLQFSPSIVVHAQSVEPNADQAAAGAPKDPKAVKTFELAIECQKKGEKGFALEYFRKAFKQDDGQCRLCLARAFSLAMSMGAYKDAEEVARQWLPIANSDSEKASVHFGLGRSLQEQGLLEKKDRFFTESRDEFQSALALKPTLTPADYELGVALAYLHQDDEARAAFTRFLDQDTKTPLLHDRAERFVDRIDLARSTMAPPFSLTTMDGRYTTMDGLAGKVVLIDFWATWCVPCREALPRIRNIARKFDGQPLVVLSISLDVDDAKWKDFVAKNGMSWMQYREGGFGGPIAKRFNVKAIPATFSIDADGVLEDQHVGDASIEGKLKKMIARAVEVQNRKPSVDAAVKPSGAGN